METPMRRSRGNRSRERRSGLVDTMPDGWEAHAITRRASTVYCLIALTSRGRWEGGEIVLAVEVVGFDSPVPFCRREWVMSGLPSLLAARLMGAAEESGGWFVMSGWGNSMRIVGRVRSMVHLNPAKDKKQNVFSLEGQRGHGDVVFKLSFSLRTTCGTLALGLQLYNEPDISITILCIFAGHLSSWPF